ncbi:transcription termination/antitermination protein NusG [Tengunoibacter tsumagoiensis]|uniref:NusG-like N-terminal domain-containing protein n=1 Tax=Tengunoibacter tsumagoiensis TaxID=2014871 RepID=A0A402A674_9CHLR|nr:transcription termination/antitermination NusG family protein [Tengunoibacter tsumagoiensis]GCE14515.1 hypothetical protein KTT_43740 [Tengunoibacter tsumagoiensis]
MNTITAMPSLHLPWYVLQCKPRMEDFAAHSLRSLMGLVVYIPKRKVPSKGRTIPLFPGYVFIQADLQIISPSCINATAGVVRLVSFSGEPAILPTDVMMSLQEKVALLDASEPVVPGSVEPLRDDVWRGLESLVTSSTSPMHRVQIFLHLLGRQQELHLQRQRREQLLRKG